MHSWLFNRARSPDSCSGEFHSGNGYVEPLIMFRAFRSIVIFAVLLPLSLIWATYASDRLATVHDQIQGSSPSESDPLPPIAGSDDLRNYNHSEHDHRPRGSLARVRNVHDLSDQMLSGVNVATAELKSLLTPGTIVHFWASWCAPCAEEIPDLNRFYLDRIEPDRKSGEIRLISVSNDQDAAPAHRFMTRHNVSFPVYLDPDQQTNAALVGERALPATIIVDKAGRFHRLALGKLNWDHPGLWRILQLTAAKDLSRRQVLQ